MGKLIPPNFYIDSMAAARFLGVSRQTMRRYLDRGYVKATKIPGKHQGSWRVDWNSLVRFKEEREV